jgi:hypothetical protein
MSISLLWWCAPVILVLRRLRQEDLEFEASLGCDSYSITKKIKRMLKFDFYRDFFF